MREIHSLAELTSLVGQEVAVSDWIEISQQRINTFAEATGDMQWIHIDVERAKRESPFGTPIAHGFLTLSLLPMLMQNAIHISYIKMGVNYGLNKVRFPAPVPVGSKLRGHLKLLAVEKITDGAQMSWEISVEREGGDKPVCVAESIARIYE
ncbi:MaoC family dehydratase [Undibacterium sp.]|uniref:MaoC family dehydratase n=1 Tax=Undibacterium sp. TaxID=1914977 RepID=UPI0025F5E2C0|nr:MaoC family dehydratase [Undibacterium sp.]